jgi:hypothetical protein
MFLPASWPHLSSGPPVVIMVVLNIAWQSFLPHFLLGLTARGASRSESNWQILCISSVLPERLPSVPVMFPAFSPLEQPTVINPWVPHPPCGLLMPHPHLCK